MPSIFKSIAPSDYTITPFEAYYKYSYSYLSGSSNNSEDVKFFYGKKFSTSSGLRKENFTYDLFDAVIQQFYSTIPYAAYGTSKQSYVPQNEVYVISVTQDLFGERIVPGSFSIKLGTSQSIDDGKGNIILSSSIIGRVFYDKGIAVIKPKDKPNLNPDPLWQNGNTSPIPGWEFLIETSSTDTLDSSKGVVEPYPGSPTIAAKIATRTSAYWNTAGFYSQSVSTGQTYIISGWVYAGATTFRAILNNKMPGTDSPMGYLLTYLDSSNNVLGYEGLTTQIGATGWNYLSKKIVINDSNIASFTIAAYIDGPYPYGFGYGDPVCTQQEAAQGCPGYAWFAGFKIENEATNSSIGLDSTGLYITGGVSLTTNFTSSVTLHENSIRTRIAPNDFLYSVHNPTINSQLSGSSVTPIQLQSSGSLRPYITTLGFYNDNNELLAVAKTSIPIQRTADSVQTFVVKFDT